MKQTKTIRTKVYRFAALSQEAQFKALCNQIKFEIDTMTEDSPYMEAAEEMERMRTPWFLGETLYHTPKYRKMLIDTIEANDYWFTIDGKLS